MPRNQKGNFTTGCKTLFRKYSGTRHKRYFFQYVNRLLLTKYYLASNKESLNKFTLQKFPKSENFQKKMKFVKVF